MRKSSGKSAFFWLFGPILLYWIISFVAQFILEMILLAPHTNELLQMLTVSDATTNEEMMQQTLNSALAVYEWIYPYQVQIVTFGAICTLPFTIRWFRQTKQVGQPVGVIVELSQKKKINGKCVGMLLGLGVTVCLGLNCMAMMANLAFYSASYQETSQQMYAASLPVQILCLGILIPIAEEVIFRGVIFARFRVTLSFWKAAFYATLLFSFSHSNLVQFLYAFCVGLLLAFVYERYQTLWAPILLHICLNLTSLLVTAGKGFDWLVAQPLRMCVLAVVCTFAGSVLVMQMQQSKENKVVEVE